MTLASCSRVSTVERSSSGMMFDGNTMRPCRFRTNASDMDGSSLLRSSTARGALHPPFDGGDEARAQLGGGDDRVHRADPAGALDVVDGLELGSDLAELLGAHTGAQR